MYSECPLNTPFHLSSSYQQLNEIPYYPFTYLSFKTKPLKMEPVVTKLTGFGSSLFSLFRFNVMLLLLGY